MKEKQLTIHKIIWYVLIFSIIGLIIETLYGFITMGIIESRKGLILGPFCPIYGVGAAFLIVLLNEYKGKKIKLFFYGSLYGAIFEYICSYVLQIMYGSKFWDYSYMTYQINGRISLIYMFFWGILSIILIEYIITFLDKFISKIPEGFWDKFIITFLVIDVFLTILGISVYMDRAKYAYEGIEKKKNILDYIFNDNIMSYTFPNLRYTDSSGNSIFVRDIIK